MGPIPTRLILLLLSLALSCHVVHTVPVVHSPWGTLEGIEVEGAGGRKMSGYLGIPFALPPTGPLRWQRPRPHPGPGPGNVFLATQLKPACPQELPGLGVYNGLSEDCLTLNVFVPLQPDGTSSPIPVLIFIHGGGFTFGDAPPYRPTKLVADEGIIVVTIQYRLGTLGFLTTGDDLVKGNFGLWDQVMAIRWVKDNIRAFGGDPEAITISGESAGGMSVGCLMVSPHTKGLFQRAVLQSGTPNFITDFISDEAGNFVEFTKALGCGTESSERMVECLRTKTAEEVVNTTSVLGMQSSEMVLFLTRVDGDLLPGRPLDLLKDEEYTTSLGLGDLDIVVGFTNREGAVVWFNMILAGEPLEAVTDPAAFATMLDMAVVMGNQGKMDHTVKKVVEFFYRGGDAGTDRPVPMEVTVDMMGDVEFFAPSVQWLRTLAGHTHTGSRYLYVLDHDFDYNQPPAPPGAHHGDDLFLEFEMLHVEESAMMKMNKTKISEHEEPLSDSFVGILASFVKTGNAGAAMKQTTGVDWPQFTSKDEVYFSLSLTPEVKRDVYKDRVALWLQLVPQLGQSEGETREASDVSPKDEL